MQTLISAFKDRGDARRARDKLLAAGFDSADIHLQEPATPSRPAAAATDRTTDRTTEMSANREIGERTMDSAEREIAADEGTLQAIGDFFVSLFGKDREAHARRYSGAVKGGKTLLVLDAPDDAKAEMAATILHDCRAIDVDDHHEGRTARAGVHAYQRDASPTLRDLVDQRHMREESILATRAAQVTRDNEERAIASNRISGDKDRPR